MTQGRSVPAQEITERIAFMRRTSGATRKTSVRDLAALVERAVLERIGTRKDAYYRLARK